MSRDDDAAPPSAPEADAEGSFGVRLRVHEGPRDPDRFPDDDDALGQSVFALVTAALDKGLPRPALLALRPDRVQQFDVVPLLHAPEAARQRMMAAMAGQPEVGCAALAGVLEVRLGREAERTRAVVVYLEWTDNRWWTAWQRIDGQRQLVGDAPVVRRAVDGWPRPGGVGGWFALARRAGLRLRMNRPGAQAGEHLVH